MERLLNYMKDNEKVGLFGIPYLDWKLNGILKNDLILVGARSGAGKSTLANIIATANKNNGVKVALFSLENFKDDGFVEKAFYKYRSLTGNFGITLRQFASGEFQRDDIALKKSQMYAEECFNNIEIINRQHNFDIEKLKEEIIKQAQNGCKLIILDHLDYVDKYDNDTEYTHINSLMKTIREAQDCFHVAVVAMSHLRKSINSKIVAKIPSIDEFIGSSNKVKEATAVIMFAPDDEGNQISTKNKIFDRKSTWCCVRKLRMGGIDNQAVKLLFNTKTGTYENEYQVYAVDYSGCNLELIR